MTTMPTTPKIIVRADSNGQPLELPAYCSYLLHLNDEVVVRVCFFLSGYISGLAYGGLAYSGYISGLAFKGH